MRSCALPLLQAVALQERQVDAVLRNRAIPVSQTRCVAGAGRCANYGLPDGQIDGIICGTSRAAAPGQRCEPIQPVVI